MNVIGISGLDNSVAIKRREFPGLSEREYAVAQGFDAAAALVDDHGIVAAAAEERFTRKKATGAFPVNAIRFCLEAGKLAAGKVDLLAHGFAYEPFKSAFEGDEYSRRQYREVFSPEAQKDLVERHFGGADWGRRFVPVPHHLAHAASAFYPSGMGEALILVSDGMGEAHSMTVALGKGRDITVLAQIPAFHSLGMLYGVFTLYLGFYMNSDEYKVMGLAPYGDPRRFYDRMMQFVSLKSDGTYTIPILANDVTLRDRETHAGVLEFLEQQFGPARDPEAEMTQVYQDVAAALQAMLQTCQLHLLKHFQEGTGQKNLCMAGGVALNCSANGVIRRSGLFERVFVQPAAGDDGCAVGAALYAHRLYNPRFTPRKMGLPLWGPEFSEGQIRQAVAGRTDCAVAELDNFDAICREVAARLAEGQVVAWFQGRMEFGPRALGSRSILADPRDPGMRDRINSLVKKRESFRPFAPVVTKEAAAAIFDIAPGSEETYSHMLFVTPVRAEFRDRLPAVTHVDGSARIQTVAREESPRLWRLLKAFEAQTGLPVLLNTSFNVRGQPIICTPQEAVETFLAAHLDLLVMGNLLVTASGKESAATPGAGGEVLRVKELYDLAARHEGFWVARLESLEPISLPYRRRKAGNGKLAEARGKQRQRIPAEILQICANGSPSNRIEILATGLGAFLARITGTEVFDLGLSEWAVREKIRGFEDRFEGVVPLRMGVETGQAFGEALKAVRAELGTARERGFYARDLAARYPSLRDAGGGPKPAILPVSIQIIRTARQCPAAPASEAVLVISEIEEEYWWDYDANLFEAETMSALARHFETFLKGLASRPDEALFSIPLLSEAEGRRVLAEWNGTRRPFERELCIHEFVEAQARKTPDAIAAVFEDRQLTYGELDERTGQLAAYLRKIGVGPEVLVGVCMEVSLEMLVGLLGVLKAGGAYVPLDPDYPRDRIGFMVRDARMPVVLTQERLLRLLPEALARAAAPSAGDSEEAGPILGTQVICLDSQWEAIAGKCSMPSAEANAEAAPPAGGEPETPGPGVRAPELPAGKVTADNLAYVIYTSGSTGKPKGVMVTHRNVANFFAGMDERLGDQEPGVWLAVTSISFDISVLELFWTLARGFKVVLHRPQARRSRLGGAPGPGSYRPMDFSLFYFAADESAAVEGKYRLLLEGARFADREGFAAVWTPERHFHAFGGLYPNPSVTSAAIATLTSRVQIRAGSVVLPLHHPIRVAEEWAMVDNLSNGRVGISVASGWQVNDFVLAPGSHSGRRELTLRQLDILRRLWRGETIDFDGAEGKTVPVRILPRPIQSELPVWITASGSPETFRVAGEVGANLLTHLLGQTASEVEEKIKVYRAAWRKHGHGGEGRVTLMLHTFVGEDAAAVREKVRAPMTAYLRSSIDLMKNDPLAFSGLKRPAGQRGAGGEDPAAGFSQEEIEAMAAHAFERYFETSGLFGTPGVCLERIEQLRQAGVDEIACLIDFGVDGEAVLGGLRHLNHVKKEAQRPARRAGADFSLPTLMARHAVTHMQCTPSLASILADDPRALLALRSLQKLMLGGEALPSDLLGRLEVSGQVLNMYGPTETTIWSTTHSLDKKDSTVLIGRPIANTVVFVVDKRLQPVPVGVPGELLIGGAGVVRGYLNRPELTAEKFIPNPFSGHGETAARSADASSASSPGQETGEQAVPAAMDGRLYRTGDLVRYLPDGTIEFLGRLDQQVKLRGFRIELGEIEAALRPHPEVKDCAAVVRQEWNGEKRLVAYVVPGSSPAPTAKSLREYLAGQLPDYMIPSAFVTLEALPLTPNGKLDRKALPVPESVSEPERRTTPPGTDVEKEVARAWCSLLGVGAVGLEDNFFELGGNSVLATQLISRLRQKFACELPLQVAFEFPILGAQADAVAAQAGQHRVSPLPRHEAIRRRKNADEWPLSSAQRRLWFLSQLEPGPHYNDHFELRLSGPLEVETLERALNEIVRRHEMLRSTYLKVEGSPVQVIAPALAVPLAAVDLSGWPESEREAEAARLAIEQARLPFRLDKGPLVRAGLFRLAAREHLLSLALHHIVIDGWSRGVLLRELAAIYEAFRARRPSPLPELEIQYADFAAWQQECLEREAMRKQVDYWRAQLRGAPPLLALPADHARPAVQSYRGAREPLELDRGVIERLAALGRQEGCTLFMVLLAAFQTLLARATGREDIIVGSPIANRNRAELENLIGFFLNSLVLRGDLSGDPSFLELLGRTRKIALEAYAHQDLPFEALLAALQPVRDLSYGPLFQVMFVLQNAPFAPASAGGVMFRAAEIDTGISKCDLTLNLEDTPERCGGWIEYCTDLFEPATIRRFIGHFQTLLESLSARPEQRVWQVALPGLVTEWAGGETPAPRSADASSAGAGEAGTLGPCPTGQEPIEPQRADSEVARKLAVICAEALGIERIGLNDSLFDLGAHSLLITRILARIEREFQVEVPIQAFFETPTVGAIAGLIAASPRQAVSSRILPQSGSRSESASAIL
jgi:natural product biosynthesis luciferase-like monooxygenase protein